MTHFAARALLDNRCASGSIIRPTLALAAGTRLGVYEIVASLGAGGMGQVYRAIDTTLGRQVAIKILPEAFASDPERVARFEREAKTLAALNHPHIAAIYAVERSAGVHALVMELVEGDDLSERIARGPIPIEDALPIARQVTEALEAAHEQGIVHRDLKPANIKVRADGAVKVLDFGLAKALEPGTLQSGAADAASSPTITSPAGTLAGVILGTAAYMSPEQAAGRVVDRRSDLWSLGVVLLEMLTGRPVFTGEAVTLVLASVLKDTPSLDRLPPGTPPAIRRLLRRCLERDPRRRLADAASARIEIEEAMAGGHDPAPESTAGAASRAGPGWTAMAMAIAATALVAAGLAWAVRRPAPAPQPQYTLTIVPPDGVVPVAPGNVNSAPHVSPDGSAVVLRSIDPPALFVRRLDAMDWIKVPGSESTANEPFWHGSSRLTVPVITGPTRALLDFLLPDGAPTTVMTYSGNSRGGGWTGDGQVVLGGRLLSPGPDRAAVPINGQDADRLLYPDFIPGTADFVAWRPSGTEGEVCFGTIAAGAVTNLTTLFGSRTAARYTPSGGGRLLFVRNDALYAQRFDHATRIVEGEPELIVKGVASQPLLSRADFDVADNGTIVWRPGGTALSRVSTYDRQGKVTAVSGPPSAVYSIYSTPADDSRLLVYGQPQWLGRVADPGRGVLLDGVSWLSWSQDGRRIFGTRGNVLVSRAVEGEPAEATVGSMAAGIARLWALSPDARSVLGLRDGRAVWAPVAEMSEPAAWRAISDADEGQVDVSFSPDGRFVLYTAGSGIYVQPFPGPGRRQRIADTGVDPVWRGDGREIVFERDDAVWSVTMTGSATGLTPGEPRRLFGGLSRAPGTLAQNQRLAVSRDGSRIHAVTGVDQPAGGVIHVLIGRP